MNALEGKRVVNTRAAHQAAELDELLRARGAQPLSYPCIRIEPPEDPARLDEALREAVGGAFDWLLLTSANVVHAVAGRLAALDVGPLPAELRLGAIGGGTAQAAERELGRVPDLLPDEALAEGLLAAFPRRPGLRVLLPQGDLARPLLARGLQEQDVAVAAVAGVPYTRGQRRRRPAGAARAAAGRCSGRDEPLRGPQPDGPPRRATRPASRRWPTCRPPASVR